jgi:hypothetical protein
LYAKYAIYLPMKASYVSNHRSAGIPTLSFGIFLVILFSLLLSFGLHLFHPDPVPEEKNRVNMEKSSGRNGKHSNPKVRASAERQEKAVRDEIDRIRNKPGVKSKEDKEALDRLRKQLDHFRRKKNWKGEQHSQKAKGN